MKFKDELCQKIFDGEELKAEVKEKLLEIADAFIEFLEVPTEAIKDIVLTGSMMSYNYTKYSDIDLHLLVDFEKVHEDCPVVGPYLISKKSEFNKNHDVFIYGIPVEVYAESIDNTNVHNGLYSLQQDKWIDFPQKIEPTDNDAAVEAKYNEFKDMADNCDDSEVAIELIDRIKKMRKSGLESEGEFSTENLAFKKLRDNGVIGKLMDIKKKGIDKQLSLESYEEPYDIEGSNDEKLFDYAYAEYKRGNEKGAIKILKSVPDMDDANIPYILKSFKNPVLDESKSKLPCDLELLKQKYINGEISAKEIEKLIPDLSDIDTTSWAIAKYNKEHGIEDGFDKILSENKIAKINKQIKTFLEERQGYKANIYNVGLILKAYDIEKEWYDTEGKDFTEQLPEIMLHIIENGKIIGNKKIKREDVYTYEGADNEYALVRSRDTGWVETDYYLENVHDFIEDWQESRKWSNIQKENKKLRNLVTEALGE